MTGTGDILWNAAITPSSYDAEGQHYRAAVLEQYKLCVEMSDRISARRNAANTFFLTVNSGLIAAFAVSGGSGLSAAPRWAVTAGLLVVLAQCAAWWITVRSYRQLNSAKYRVIALLEERLPAMALSRAEWRSLGEGADWRIYVPLSLIEMWVPLIFGSAYVLGFGALLWS
ncbi:hypothetical protein AB0A66_10955 [Streptomyces longwoodensis]|uniref:RipA family octameric membrane protein n=1 Tax=Streptomyces longwoodensis TaxID=68231 RepID=UPI0033C05A56